MKALSLPDEIDHWTADEVAECLSYGKHLPEGEGITLYRRLYQILSEAANPTPLGGDGSNGTVELPEDRLDPSNDDKPAHWWDKLTPPQQKAITAAVRDEFGGAA